MEEGNPFANWELETQQSTPSKNKQDLQRIYFRSKKQQTQLQEISKFNEGFFQEADSQRQQNNNSQNMEDRCLLKEETTSAKALPAEVSRNNAIAHFVLMILTTVFSRDSVYLIAITWILQVLLLGLLYVHQKRLKVVQDKLNRSNLFLVQIITMAIADIFLLKITLDIWVLYLTVLLAGYDIYMLNMLLKLRQAQKVIDHKFPAYQLEEFESQILE